MLLLFIDCSVSEIERRTVGIIRRKSSFDCSACCISSAQSWPAAAELSVKQDHSGRSGVALPLHWQTW